MYMLELRKFKMLMTMCMGISGETGIQTGDPWRVMIEAAGQMRPATEREATCVQPQCRA